MLFNIWIFLEGKRPHFCSMKITQDVREYAAQKRIDEQAALGVGMKEKAEEFVAAGAEIYQASNT
jgi:phosphomethylpyrimidine synthase